jgi:hypothetical protein
MKIINLKLSFIQVGCFSEPLSSLNQPAIPFSFLISGPAYQQRFVKVCQSNQSNEKVLWPGRGGYGKLFWNRYIQNQPAPVKDLWRLMVPFFYDLDVKIIADWLNGTVASRIYLYPWGIGLVLDVFAYGSLTLDDAANLGFQVERQEHYNATLNGVQRQLTMRGLLEFLLTSTRNEVFGYPVPGQMSEMLSIVTVLDADGANATQPVIDGGDLHRMMEGMVGWNPLYKSISLAKLDSGKIQIKAAPPGHVLLGGRRGRFVWFPGHFYSNSGSTKTLNCYHQNLAVASLQTESLCLFAKDVTDQINANTLNANTSAAYRSCAQLTAGVLGRLYGGTIDTYRCGSIRDQIAKTYRPAVDGVRQFFTMPPLVP